MTQFLKILIVFTCLAHSLILSAKPLTCPQSLMSVGSYDSSLSLTDNYVAYLLHLAEDNTLTTAQLEKMVSASRKESQLVHPINQQLSTNSDLIVHYETLKEYLDHKPDLEQVLTQVQSFIDQKSGVSIAKAESSEATAKPEVEIKFRRIERPHTYEDGKTVILTFEVMETLVTQSMWIKMMGQNPSESASGGDYPIENLTYFSAVEFADRLSKQRGLSEVYQYYRHNVTFKGTAEAGDLEAYQGPLFIDAPNEDIYQTEGYRLPTDEEMIFLLTNYEKSENFDVKKFAWVGDNSGYKTHPVATLPPLLVQGQAFYDLVGNVRQWLHTDRFSSTNFGWDYWGKIIGPSYNQTIWHYPVERYDQAVNMSPNMRLNQVGFRLVRSLPKSSR